MFRKILFWFHLVLGLVAGLAIAVMCFTGAALAFEREIITWAERDARDSARPAPDAPPLGIDELLRRVRAAHPELRVANLNLSDDVREPLRLGTPGNTNVYVNRWTGEARAGEAPRTRAFMQAMRRWHTHLNVNRPGPGNPGEKVNAAANVVFVFLIAAGLVLWWPAAWHWRVLRPSVWFTSARGRARDWNWHNVFGIWSLPVLLVLAMTGVVLSYRWANELAFRMAGDRLPPPGAPAPVAPLAKPAPAAPAPSRPEAAAALSPEALVGVVQQRIPAWDQLTLRFNPPLGAPAPRNVGAKTATVMVHAHHQWPPFSLTTLTLDAATGEARRTEGFADLSPGMRARRWIRLLHSGEALLWPGQLAAGLACLAACILVYTGFALSWRRFFGRTKS